LLIRLFSVDNDQNINDAMSCPFLRKLTGTQV
jgi:hypothetical protein